MENPTLIHTHAHYTHHGGILQGPMQGKKGAELHTDRVPDRKGVDTDG